MLACCCCCTRALVLAHLKHIKYLDYRLVDQQAVVVAKEQCSPDGLLGLEETEKPREAVVTGGGEGGEGGAPRKAAMKGAAWRALTLSLSHARARAHCNAPFPLSLACLARGGVLCPHGHG